MALCWLVFSDDRPILSLPHPCCRRIVTAGVMMCDIIGLSVCGFRVCLFVVSGSVCLWFQGLSVCGFMVFLSVVSWSVCLWLQADACRNVALLLVLAFLLTTVSLEQSAVCQPLWKVLLSMCWRFASCLVECLVK